MPQTKKPTPLSTYALAAFMTWKQFDLLLLLKQEGSLTTSLLSDHLEEIHKYDKRHGGAFYIGTSHAATYASLRTLENRQLVHRHIGQNGLTQWTATARAQHALAWLEDTKLYAS
jgi:hypothetical protein